MLEVSKHVPARGQVPADAIGHAAAFFIGIAWLAETIVNKVARDHVRRGALFGLRDAECCLVRSQHFQVASANHDSCRNSNAAGTARGRIARKSWSRAASAFRLGGS